MRRQILPYADNTSLIIANPDVAAVLTSRSEWGSSGGIDYSDQVRVFCGNQAIFTAHVEKEVARVMAELNRLWEYKPKMMNPHPTSMADSDVQYYQPSIKQREFHPEIGVAAFVTEEQIDHRLSDPEIRYELYVLTAGNEKAEVKAENYGYGREGGAFLTILEIGRERIVINTKSGKKVIALR